MNRWGRVGSPWGGQGFSRRVGSLILGAELVRIDDPESPSVILQTLQIHSTAP